MNNELLKGKFNGNCNRSLCQERGAIYLNHFTRRYYCRKCANLLNLMNAEESFKIFGHELCTLQDKEKV